MQALNQIPLLARLPRVELAKLVSEIRKLDVAAGADLPIYQNQKHGVCFVQSGKIGVFWDDAGSALPLMYLGSGEVISDHLALDEDQSARFVYRATEPSVVLLMDSPRFQDILSEHPELLRQFSDSVVRRSRVVLEELARTKIALRLHANEFWTMLEDASQAAENVSAATAATSAEITPFEQPKSRGVTWQVLVRHGLPIAAALLAFLGGTAHLTITPFRAGIAVLVWGVCTWLFDSLPDFVVAIVIVMVAGVIGLVKPEVAFSGFASRTWFLLLAVLGISAGISRTGLLYRVALHMLRLFPATYTGQATALALGGLVLAPFLPGVTGRQAMASRLALELSEAMGFKPNSKGSAGIAMACFLGFSCIYYISLTGGSVTLMVWSVLPDAAKANLNWSTWFLAALPLAGVVFLGTLFVILRLYKPEAEVNVSREIVDSQLRVLGPMNHHEWITVGVVASIVIAFITQPLHGIDPTWVALPGFLLLCSTNILDRDTLRKGIDWSFLLLTGGLLGIATITSEGGFVKFLSAAILPLTRPVSGNPWLFFTAVAVITAVIHLAVPFQPTILLTALALAPVASKLGYNPFLVGLVILVMASHFVVPHSNPLYMAAYGGSERRAFGYGQTRTLALIHAGITLLAVWAAIPFWTWLGMM
jgi:anion transporter